MLTIRRGSSGDDVVILQNALNNLGYDVGKTDGIFGPKTEQAVKIFQKDHELSVDGIVGPITWGALEITPAQSTQAGIEPVYYCQSDPRWGRIMYSNHNDHNQTIGSSGCGTTSMAMILATWVDDSITPLETSNWSMENNYRTYNQGTDYAFFPYIAERFGLNLYQTRSTDEVVNHLCNGALVVASMGPGYFTKGGHYIVSWAVDTDNEIIICHDPAKMERNCAYYDIFRNQTLNYFVFKLA